MKSLLKLMGTSIAAVIAWLFGEWLWREVIKEKLDNLKHRLTRKD